MPRDDSKEEKEFNNSQEPVLQLVTAEQLTMAKLDTIIQQNDYIIGLLAPKDKD